MSNLKIEVCFSPKLFVPENITENHIVVIVDILRATTSICTAFQYGVESIIPVGSIAEAEMMKEKGFCVAAELEGVKLDFADYGNSAFQFMNLDVKGKTIVYNTTNGVTTLLLAKNAKHLAIGAFSNISALTQWLKEQQKNVYILCSGWKGYYCTEDALFAGALADFLLKSGGDFICRCDSGNSARTLWQATQHDLLEFVQQASHVHRLERLGLGDVIPYSFTLDSCPVVPILQNGVIVKKR